MLGGAAIGQLAARVRANRGLAAKRDIAAVAKRLSLSADSVVPVGDDCAAIPDGDGFLLFAIEGFMNEFVADDPWFAGWCGVMVNISDVAAMGGRPIAVVDAVWAAGEGQAAPVLDGMRAASAAYGVPIVGGHSNARTDRGQLAVAILGRAKRLLTSFDARPDDRLIAAIDLRGRIASHSRIGKRRQTRRRSGLWPISKSCRRLPRAVSRLRPRIFPKAASSALR